VPLQHDGVAATVGINGLSYWDLCMQMATGTVEGGREVFVGTNYLAYASDAERLAACTAIAGFGCPCCAAPDVAGAADSRNGGRQQRQSRSGDRAGRNRKPKVPCPVCHKTGHTEDRCYVKFPQLKLEDDTKPCAFRRKSSVPGENGYHVGLSILVAAKPALIYWLLRRPRRVLARASMQALEADTCVAPVLRLLYLQLPWLLSSHSRVELATIHLPPHLLTLEACTS